MIGDDHADVLYRTGYHSIRNQRDCQALIMKGRRKIGYIVKMGTKNGYIVISDKRHG
jgi:ribosomal protein L34